MGQKSWCCLIGEPCVVLTPECLPLNSSLHLFLPHLFLFFWSRQKPTEKYCSSNGLLMSLYKVRKGLDLEGNYLPGKRNLFFSYSIAHVFMACLQLQVFAQQWAFGVGIWSLIHMVGKNLDLQIPQGQFAIMEITYDSPVVHVSSEKEA